MADRYTRRTGVLCKVEAVYGVAETVFTAADGLLFVEPPQFLIEADNVARNLVTPWMGNSEELPATRRAKLNFKVELAGAGVAGTRPPGASSCAAAALPRPSCPRRPRCPTCAIRR